MNKSKQVRDWYDAGVIDMSPEKKEWAARQLGIRVQTVHAALARHTGNSPQPFKATTSNIPVTSSIREAILEAHNKAILIARKAGHNIQSLPVRFDLKGGIAGMFCYSHYRYNIHLAESNREAFLKDTPQHEVAHQIVDMRFGRLTKSHGWEWKQIMRNVFGQNPERCHSFDCSGSKSGRRRYPHACKCTIHHLSANLHNKIVRGQRRTCRRCHTVVSKTATWTEESTAPASNN